VTPKKKTLALRLKRARSGKHRHAGVLVRAPAAEREAWEAAAAAAAAGLQRAAWIRGELNAAAARQADIDSILTPAQRRAKKDRAKKG
jgi:hypothetical protein